LDLKVSAPSNARTLYDRALQIDPNNPYILLNRGILRRDRLSDAAGGASDFQAAVAADSNFHPAQYELGNMAYDARRYSEAAGFFRQAVAGDTQSARYRRNLILALIQLGSTREARPHFRALCRLDAGASDLPRLAVVLGVPLPAAARV
jgi:tetratricopeptide (TPR) repeat protein